MRRSVFQFILGLLLIIFGFSTVNGIVPLHEWTSQLEETDSTNESTKGRPLSAVEVDESGNLRLMSPENLTTWIFEGGTFIPMAKLKGYKSYSIITDHLGTPIESYDEEGTKVWSRELGIYGQTRKEVGEENFIPFLYQGQYLDTETELAYNRYRYYSPESGSYISQDPIGLAGGLQNVYSYVEDVNSWIDTLGMAGTSSFSDLMHAAENDLDFSTSKDGAVFWSGQNMHTAQQWAADNGKTTLEQTKGGKYLNDLDLFNPKNGLTGSEAAQVWDVASKKIADGASGDVNVFSTGAKRFGPYGERTWWRIEKKALLSNSNVNNIFRRKQNGAKAKTGHVRLKCS